MLKIELWISSLPQAELDRRAREARLRLEQLERLLMPYVAVKPMRPGRLPRVPGWRLSLRGFGRRGRRTRGPLSDRRPSAVPEIRRDRQPADCAAVHNDRSWAI